MNVGQLCNREVVVAESHESVRGAARLMAEQHVGCLVVVRTTGVGRIPIGIVTDRDLALRVLVQDPARAASLHIADVMSSDLLTATEQEDLYDVLKQMRSRGVRRIPVVDEDDILQGILAYDDVIESVAEELWDLTRLLVREREHERKP